MDDTLDWKQSQTRNPSLSKVTDANGVVIVRFHDLTAARGFRVANDKQSALLNVAEITEGLRTGQGESEFYLKWDVAP